MNERYAWNSIFEYQFTKEEPASAATIREFRDSWNRSLTAEEIYECSSRQTNPFPVSSPLHSQYKPLDPSTWRLPQQPLPDSYLQLLAYANGGEFQTGERNFAFFGTEDLREMNLVYEIPYYMAGAVSFGMDGGGNHYLFDMRAGRVNGEYPIILASSGNLGFEDCIHAANSLLELCTGREALDG